MRGRITGRALLCFLGAALAGAMAVTRATDAGFTRDEYGHVALLAVGAIFLVWSGLRGRVSPAE